MEKQAIFNLDINTGNSAKNLSNTEKELNKLRNDIKNSGNDTKSFEKNLQNLNKVVDSSNLTYKDLNKVIQDYQTIALQAGRESAVGLQAIERAAKLRDEQGKLQASTKRLANDQKNLQAAMELGQGVIAGYTAFQGVTAMLGVENEELLQTITKLQAAQATLNGMQQISKTLNQDSVVILRARALALSANNAATGIATKLLRLFNIQVVAGNVALGITTFLLQALGIGLLVAAVAALIANWEKLTAVFTNSTRALAEFVGLRDKEFEAMKEQQADRLQMIGSEIDAVKDRATAQEQAINRHIARLKAEGKDVQDLENQKIRIRIAANEAQKKLFKEEAVLIETRRRLNGELTADEEKRLEQIKASYVEILRANKDLTNQLEINEITSANKRKTESQKQAQERLAEEKKQADLTLQVARLIEDFKLQAMEEGEEKRRLQLAISQERERADLIAKYGEDTELIKALEEKQAKELADFQLNIDNAILAEAQRVADEKDKIEAERLAKLEIQRQEDLHNEYLANQQRIAMASGAFNVIGALAEGFAGDNEERQKQAFKINQLASIADTGVMTFQAAQAAYLSQMKLPTPDAPIRATAAASLAVGAGLAQIAKIKNTKFGGGVPSAATPPTPTTSNEVETTQLQRGLQDAGIRNNPAEMEGQQGGQQPQQVYVLETDIRNVANRVDAIETRAVV